METTITVYWGYIKVFFRERLRGCMDGGLRGVVYGLGA